MVRREDNSVDRVLRWVASCLLVSRALLMVVREVGRIGCVVVGALMRADWRADELRRFSRSGLLWPLY